MKKSIKVLCGTLASLAAVFLFAVACNKGDSALGSSGGGDGTSQGGSMARFTINGDYLYTVDQRTLNIVSLADPSRPFIIEDAFVGWDIETIFTMDDYLFIGSRSAMYIYDISNPAFPQRLSETTHFRSCDPVVAYGNFAFVTLNSEIASWCGNQGNVLRIYDITDMTNPVRLVGENLSSPRGLAVDGPAGLVFVCDKNAVKAFEFNFDAENPVIKGKFTSATLPEVKRIDAYDCIVLDGTLLVIGADGLYQLAYDSEKFTFISKIDLRTR